MTKRTLSARTITMKHSHITKKQNLEIARHNKHYRVGLGRGEGHASARHNKVYTPDYRRMLDHYGGPCMPTVITSVFDVVGDAKEAATITTGLALFKNNLDKLSHTIGGKHYSKTVTASRTEPRSTITCVAQTRMATGTQRFM